MASLLAAPLEAFASIWGSTFQRKAAAQGVSTALGDDVGDARKLPSAPQHVVQVGQSTFALKRKRDGQDLVCAGTCHVSYFGIQLCDAALYMEPDTSSAQVLDSGRSKELHIRYLRYIPGSQFKAQTSSLVAKNGFLDAARHGSATVAETQTNLDEFNGLYRDVNAGDSFTLSYDHRSETSSLCLNETRLGHVRGAAFSRALFSVWFGEHPFLAYLKTSLLAPLPKTFSEAAMVCSE